MFPSDTLIVIHLSEKHLEVIARENDAAVAVMVAVFPRIIGLKRLMARSLQVVIISLRNDNIHLI